MKVIVTGAAGFIGSNIVAGLNASGIDDVLAVDDLTDGSKFKNLVDLSISDYVDQAAFYEAFSRGAFGQVAAVFHEGACSNTMETNGRFMLESNYRCSKTLLDACAARNTRLIYASSAAVYGASDVFTEDPANERPINVYGYSKLLFDRVVRRVLTTNKVQVAGLRYFNVFGPREQHKGTMASVAFHHFNQFRDQGTVKLFAEYGGYAAGTHSRDFVFVDDVVAVNLWLLQNPQVSGIFNVGSGKARPFNDVALSVINSLRSRSGQEALPLSEALAQGLLTYIPFPESLKGKYQCFTQADLHGLRLAGFHEDTIDIPEGISRYAEWLCR